MFVRKVIGHFSMFALLGLGYSTCLFFFMKKRRYAFILAPLGVFSVAAWTELVQLFTPGRTGYIYDVVINFSGGMVGVVFFALCLLIYVLSAWLFSPKKLDHVKTELPKMSFAEAFKRTEIPEKEEEDGKAFKELPDNGDAEVLVLRFDGEVREPDRTCL